MNDKLSGGRGHTEVCPGPGFESDGKLKEFIANEAWGHHASCTNRMGPDGNPMAVLDSRSRCARSKACGWSMPACSPHPGYLVTGTVYMIGEKAFDVIAAS